MFQSAPPREGRPESDVTIHDVRMFQSAPPREGRLDAFLGVGAEVVSIRAPA